ncbi:hypothetical protein ZYGM_004882 [Zygosaccharomyces mellis]|uniref:Uncharacterized protein n=1 Tax=Zygosaccharomyces mellis TaxID=42258 RepID=A0A4C2DZM4_9SACH|nr:hypothetical protein ZYGM_004882 [Zygosaccharomyces mellis]
MNTAPLQHIGLTIDRILSQAIRRVGRRFYSERHSNLGHITTYLTAEGVPNLLQRSLLNEYLDDHISLRLLPTTHPYIPVLQGKGKYRASMNAVRLLATKFVLQDKAKLKIDKVITVLRGEKTNYNCITSNDKLVIKWRSCEEGDGSVGTCEKDVNLGKVRNVGEVDTSSPIISHILNPTKHELTSEIDYTQQLLRLIRGIFIFEFNEDNSCILVHTIDNVEMVDFDKIQTGALASP